MAICSLYVLNERNVTRSISSSILRPNSGGTIHFKKITDVKHVVNLEKRNEITIKTKIPDHILTQLKVMDSTKAKEVKQTDKETTTEEAQEVPPADDVEEEIVDEQPTEDTPEKPEWYLTYDEVEDMSKKDLINWFDSYDEIDIPKNKNASETKESAHEALQNKFDAHQQ